MLTVPECKFTKNINDKPKEEPEHTGLICPECGSELLKRKSRYGNYFYGCSNYPKCKHIENIDGEKPNFRRRKKKAE